MSPQSFEAQIKRLQDTYGERAYGVERCKVMWRTFQCERDEVFVEAIDELIMNQRSTPLMAELHDAMSKARHRDRERRSVPMSADFTEIFNHAVEMTDANREFVRTCKVLLMDFQSGKLSKKEFLIGCDFLDQTAINMKKSRMP